MEKIMVQVLFDKDGYLVKAGDFSDFNRREKKEMTDYILNGGQVKTISIEEYRSTEFKWIYEKRKTESTNDKQQK